MNKVYKPALYRIILNCITGIFVAGLPSVIITALFIKTNQVLYSILMAVAFYVIYILLVVFQDMIRIEVTDNELIVKKRGKEQRFILEQTSFRARSINAGRSDSHYELYAIMQDENEVLIDCELIGGRQFECLMEDLKIIGDDSEVTKIETKNLKQ